MGNFLFLRYSQKQWENMGGHTILAGECAIYGKNVDIAHFTEELEEYRETWRVEQMALSGIPDVDF